MQIPRTTPRFFILQFDICNLQFLLGALLTPPVQKVGKGNKTRHPDELRGRSSTGNFPKCCNGGDGGMQVFRGRIDGNII